MKRIFIILILFPFLGSSQVITTIAGNGVMGFSGDGGQATAAKLSANQGVVVDKNGNVFIADVDNQRIRKVDTMGIISTIAGNGVMGSGGDGGPATNGQLSDPYSLAVDTAGNIYIADYVNDRVRKVSASGIITTIAGNGILGFGGDGGPATAAQLYGPLDVAVDNSGNVYIADYINDRIRKVNALGIITTIAGNGILGYSGDGGPATAANLHYPYGVAVDGTGNLFIADKDNNCIRKVNTGGFISTIAGNGTLGFSGDGGSATSATLKGPIGVAVDGSGNVYISDLYNQRIRKVNASGSISTLAGNGTSGFSGDGGPSTAAELNDPYGISVDNNGNVYVGDYSNNRIRKIKAPIFSITGASDVCIGFTTTLSDSTIGGTWSSSNTAFATIGSITGIVMGVSVGISVITYNVSGNFVTDTVTVHSLPSAGSITGTSSVCAGSTITLIDAIAGGAWSSSNASATVSGGIVTGVSAGIDTISYSVTNMCGIATASKTITVNPLPSAGTIMGSSNVCVGSTITLTDVAPGGVWNSSNATAIVSGGIVTGVSAGADTINYTVTNMCGIATTNKTITINQLPSAGTITGLSNVCVGSIIILTDTITGGLWSSSNATAIISGGMVTGVSAGIDTISYTVTNICGSVSVNAIIKINYSDSPIIIKNGNVLYAPSGYSSYQWQLNGVPISGATLFSYIPTSLGDYNLIVTNSFGCIGFSEPIHITQCNVDDILIYPDPCESIVYIQWCGAVTLRLTCMDGKSLKAIENVNELDLGDLPNGAYLLTIFDLYGNKLKTKLITKLAK